MSDLSNITLPETLLGRTDMRISRTGFGAWAVGGGDWSFSWGPQDDAQSIAAIRHAVESGVNWIDTAAIYGLGHAEEIVARALADFSEADRPYVFTKCGLVWDEQHRRELPQRLGAPQSIRREVETSLRRLGVDRIDLYQLHWPAEDGTPIEDSWQALLDLKKEGKVRAVGLSNHSADDLARAERVGHVETLQPPFSAINRSAAAAELPWCVEHNTGVIVYSPMQSGLLTGAMTEERIAALPEDDWRRRSTEFTGSPLQLNLAVAGLLKSIAARHHTTTPAVAVAWTLAWPGITAAIVGARSAKQVDGWIGASQLTLEEADLEEIAATLERTGAGTGPVRPDDWQRGLDTQSGREDQRSQSSTSRPDV